MCDVVKLRPRNLGDSQRRLRATSAEAANVKRAVVKRLCKGRFAAAILTRRNSPSVAIGKNRYRCPDEVHKRGGIRSVRRSCLRPGEDCRRCSGAGRSGVVLPVSVRKPSHKRKQSCRSHPSNRIKPKVIVHHFVSLSHRSHHSSHFFGSFCFRFSTFVRRGRPVFRRA